MMWTFKYIYFLCILPGYLFLDPFSSGIGIGVALVASTVWNTKDFIACQFMECCQEPYILHNLTGLEANLREHVFGQHIAVNTVVSTLKAHLQKSKPKKALALSFHGMTGLGKNYVSKFVAESLFKNGMKSKYVHLFISPIHFPLSTHTEQYKSMLQQWIKGNVTACGRSLFIFDEIDKLNPGVIDAIKPFIDYHTNVDGVDYRKSIFIFLSNTGGKVIADFTLDHWKLGKSREELTLNDVEHPLSLAAFNEEGGLQKTEMIEKALLDASIPFLPLEKKHVKQCIRHELELNYNDVEASRKWTEETVDLIASHILYWPKQSQAFSTSGCKKVDKYVEYEMLV